MKKVFLLVAFILATIASNAEINEKRVLLDLNGKKIKTWTIQAGLEPTFVKIVNITKNKYFKVVRIVFKAYENELTANKREKLATAIGIFDVYYYLHDEKFANFVVNENKDNWEDNDYFIVDYSLTNNKSTQNELKEIDEFYEIFTKAVANNDKKKIYEMCEIPLVNLLDDNIEVKNQKDFLKHYDKLFTQKIKEKIIYGTIGFPLQSEPTDGDLNKGDIELISPINITTDSGLMINLIFKKVKGKIKLIGFYSFA